jgi:hypothetical protein
MDVYGVNPAIIQKGRSSVLLGKIDAILELQYGDLVR